MGEGGGLAERFRVINECEDGIHSYLPLDIGILVRKVFLYTPPTPK